MNLTDIGWGEPFASALDELKNDSLVPGRIFRSEPGFYQVWTETGDVAAVYPKSLARAAESKADLPVVGDWVGLDAGNGHAMARIEVRLPRRSRFARRALAAVGSQRVEAQVLAANVDTVFLVAALDGGRSTNLRGLERYLVMAYESGAEPVIVLNKADLCESTAAVMDEIASALHGVPLHCVSAHTGAGVDPLRQYLAEGSSVAFFGPSGVGKSSLSNRFLGRSQLSVGEVREADRRGRHTTTRTELFQLPGGGVLVDTPGLRTLQIWIDEAALDRAFPEIAEAAAGCEFPDCSHQDNAGCKVAAGLETGEIEPERWTSYRQLLNEIEVAQTHLEEARRRPEGRPRLRRRR